MIEYLLFRATARHSAKEIAEVFDGPGELNAATSRETTVVDAGVSESGFYPLERRSSSSRNIRGV